MYTITPNEKMYPLIREVVHPENYSIYRDIVSTPCGERGNFINSLSLSMKINML